MPEIIAKDDVLDRLAAGVLGLTATEEWRRWLEVARRLPQYSFNNVLLLALQCPHATHAAGFKRWLQLGRHVRKGEKALWILAPMRRRELPDPREAGEEPEPVQRIVGFRPVPVWDVSQTDGEPLPEHPPVSALQGDCRGAEELVSFALELGYTVERQSFDSATQYGVTVPATKHIGIRHGISEAQAVKTLVHELAHVLLHVGAGSMPRDLCELEAESVAYIVCDHLALDSSAYSFAYVAGWTAGEDVQQRIRDSGERILGAARQILARLAQGSDRGLEGAA